jgi:two-component system, NtrC family, nitrogen regulation response regulator NtrX
VRELRNFVERLSLLRAGGPLRLTPEAVAALQGPAPLPAVGATPAPAPDGRPYRDQVEDFERGLIRAALAQGGSTAGAARLLHVDRGNLHRRIRALGLE